MRVKMLPPGSAIPSPAIGPGSPMGLGREEETKVSGKLIKLKCRSSYNKLTVLLHQYCKGNSNNNCKGNSNLGILETKPNNKTETKPNNKTGKIPSALRKRREELVDKSNKWEWVTLGEGVGRGVRAGLIW